MATDLKEPVTRGAHHIGLTVPNLDTTRKFFVDVLNFEQVGEIADYPAAFLHDGTTMITLWQVADPVSAQPFDYKNTVGLHHLALRIANDEQLAGLFDRLSSIKTVSIEFGPELLNGGPARHMMCNIPGGLRIEFISPNPASGDT